MKILGIVGSPRKNGNTEILVTEALTVAREKGAETELVLMKDLRITGCDGCGSCFKKDKCRIDDDMQALYKQMESADGIIFGSPVYFHSVTAQMKAVMDRTFMFLKDMNLKGKVAAPVLALRRIGAGQTRTLLYGYFLSQGMIPTRGAVGYGPGKGEVRESFGASIHLSAMEEAREVGTEMVDMILQQKK